MPARGGTVLPCLEGHPDYGGAGLQADRRRWSAGWWRGFRRKIGHPSGN